MPRPITQCPAHPSNYRYGRALGPPRLLVIHTMQGTAKGTAAWFAQDHHAAGQGASSAHYGVTAAGEVLQFVDEHDTAFHAGNSEVNALSVGIELEGDCAKPDNFTPAMIAALLELAHDLCDRYGIPVARATVMGHCDVPDARAGHRGELGGAGHHTDPGPYFPWRDFLIALAGAHSPTAA